MQKLLYRGTADTLITTLERDPPQVPIHIVTLEGTTDRRIVLLLTVCAMNRRYDHALA